MAEWDGNKIEAIMKYLKSKPTWRVKSKSKFIEAMM
jgi:hypothetical protein